MSNLCHYVELSLNDFIGYRNNCLMNTFHCNLGTMKFPFLYESPSSGSRSKNITCDRQFIMVNILPRCWWTCEESCFMTASKVSFSAILRSRSFLPDQALVSLCWCSLEDPAFLLVHFPILGKILNSILLSWSIAIWESERSCFSRSFSWCNWAFSSFAL